MYKQLKQQRTKDADTEELLIIINFMIYKIHSQLTEINWVNINNCPLQVHIICNSSSLHHLN